MIGENRRGFLIKLAVEYLDAGIGSQNWREVLDAMLADGHTTYEEIGRSFGENGFRMSIIRPAARERDSANIDRYLPTATGGYIQPALMDLDQLVWVYYKRKRHMARTVMRLTILRDYIMDRHQVDPDTLPDPFIHVEESGEPEPFEDDE